MMARRLFMWMRWVLPKAIIVGTYIIILGIFLYFPKIAHWFGNDARSLNIYAFTEFISQESLELFERETGIKVYIKYFEANDDLYTKMRITGGAGYDLITPSDFMVELLCADGLLSPLQHDLLPHMRGLDTRLLEKYFDPQNQFSLPIAWMPYGIAFDKHLIAANESVSLDLLFKAPDMKRFDAPLVASKNHKICMPDDVREMVALAALYLFGRSDDLSERELEQIESLLIEQRPWVERYSDAGLQFLLLGNVVPVVFGSSIFVRSLMQHSDQFRFEIPREGSLMTIENIAIPVGCKNIELVHTLINFLMGEKIAKLNSSLYGYNPIIALSDVHALTEKNKHQFLSDEQFNKLHLIRNTIPFERLEKMWLAIKSS